MNTPDPSIEIPIAQIAVGDRLRPVDGDHAAMLAESYGSSGQLTPIEVRPDPEQPGFFILVAGAHRMAAAEIAGWSTIRAAVVDVTEDQARLREIDENLCRHELTELDRAVFLSTRKQLWLRLYPETGQGGDKRKKQNDKSVVLFPSFSAATAEKLGVSRRSVERAVRRAEALDPKVRSRIAGTRFAQRASELDALCKHPATMQRRIVDLLFHPTTPAMSVAAANERLSGKAAAVKDPAQQQLDRLMRLFMAATPKVKQRFIASLVADGFAVAPKAGAA